MIFELIYYEWLEKGVEFFLISGSFRNVMTYDFSWKVLFKGSTMNWYGKRTVFVWENKGIVISRESDVIFIFVTLQGTIHNLYHDLADLTSVFSNIKCFLSFCYLDKSYKESLSQWTVTAG